MGMIDPLLFFVNNLILMLAALGAGLLDDATNLFTAFGANVLATILILFNQGRIGGGDG